MSEQTKAGQFEEIMASMSDEFAEATSASSQELALVGSGAAEVGKAAVDTALPFGHDMLTLIDITDGPDKLSECGTLLNGSTYSDKDDPAS